MMYRKKPVEVEAVQWKGENFMAMQNFTEGQFDLVDEADREDNPEHDAQVFDTLHSTWVALRTTDWVIKGVKGEFYPCTNEVFEATYEPVTPEVQGG